MKKIYQLVGLSFCLALLVAANSCQKDILTAPENQKPEDPKAVRIETITYSAFQKNTRLANAGVLQDLLSKTVKSGEQLSIKGAAKSDDLVINTDSVKKVTWNGHTSYVFSIKTATRHAVTFQNLTIDESSEGTKAFITTYTPSKEWVKTWKLKRGTSFTGKTKFRKLDLGAVDLNGKKNSGNTIKQAIVCDSYTIVVSVEYPCSDKDNPHYPGWCLWEEPGVTIPYGEYKPYTVVTGQTVTECQEYPDPNPPTSGGGGSTTPYPPGDYDPCTEGISQTAAGNSVSAISPCDESGENEAEYRAAVATAYLSNILTSIEYSFPIAGLTVAEKEIFLEDLYYANSNEFYNNLALMETAVSQNTFNEDDPLWVKWRDYIRKMLGIDAPRNMEEAIALSNHRNAMGAVGQKVVQVYEANRLVFNLLPGYAALNDILVGDYGSAAANASFDLFGAGLFKYATTGVLNVGSKYVIKVGELASKYPNIVNYLKSIKVSEVNIIKRSVSNKVIIIGEKMEERVGPSVATFKKIFKSEIETFEPSAAAELQFTRKIEEVKAQFGRTRLTDAEMRETLVFKENVNWIIDKWNAGYNVIDIGPKIPNDIKSVSYGMERSFVYPK